MYHVVSTGLTATLLYLISYFFYRTGYFSLQLHRKFWNLLLAIAFLLTAGAGVFIALQINYKWNIPFVKALLKWHVEFGIGTAITGLFHFLWHLKYYEDLFKRTTRPTEPVWLEPPVKLSSTDLKTNLFIIGFVSASVQFLMMREIMNISGGYELITGSFLGTWLIGSAIGAALAGKSVLYDLRKLNLIFSLSPIVSLFMLLFLSRVFLSPGQTPSFLLAIIYTFLVLIPFIFVSGFTFIKLIAIAATENKFVAGKSFSIETTGGIVSGIILSFLTAGIVNTYKLLLLIILSAVAYTLTTFYSTGIKSKFFLRILILVPAVLIIFSNPDRFFRQVMLPGVKVTMSKDTPYGNITKGKYKGEESLYYNHRLLGYQNDATEREEDIHYAMLQSEKPEKVIMISGSIQSHLREILKYPVSNITYIERDPDLAKFESSSGDQFPEKLKIVKGDAYRYIRSSSDSADVIIMLIPPPTTLLLNRYFTSEFFTYVRKRLKKGGVFMCSPGPGDNYLNKEGLNLYSSIYNSLADKFKNIEPIVGNKLYLIASDNPVTLSICKLVDIRHIKNIYVSTDYLDDDLIIRKSNEIKALIYHRVRQNKSAYPVACFHSLSYQLSKNLDEKIPVIVVLLIAFVLPVTAIRRRNLMMYFTAAGLAGLEIILLLTLQILAGNMYQLTGLIIAGLMTGLAVGSGIRIPFLETLSRRIKILILLMFYIGFGLIYNRITYINNPAASVIFIIFSGFIPALLTGRLFREFTTSAEGIAVSPALYSADLAGSAFGFILISGLSVPLLGIKASVFILSALIFAGFLSGTIRK